MHNEMKLYMIYAATASCPRRGAALFPLPSPPALEHDKQFKVIMYNFRIYAQAWVCMMHTHKDLALCNVWFCTDTLYYRNNLDD